MKILNKVFLALNLILAITIPSIAQGGELPDLVVREIRCGSGNKLQFTVANSGRASLPSGWRAVANIFFDGRKMGHVDLGRPTSGDITPAGGIATYLVAFDIARPVTGRAVLDPTGSITESNERNNVMTVRIKPCEGCPSRIRERTLYEGIKNYTCDSECCYCWRDDGRIDVSWDYFFPEIETENDNIRSLLGSIGLPTEPTSDENEIWRRVRTVWSWLRVHVLREGGPNYDAACDFLRSLSGWPSIGNIADMFSRYGGLCWGTCMSRAQILTTLLYRVGIPPERIAIAETRRSSEYSQHMYVVLRLECHWYYIDPSCMDFHSVLSHFPENVGCIPADYRHPNKLVLLPGSILHKPMLVR